MMNTTIKKSPNLVTPIPRRNNEIRDEEIDNDDGIIYPPGYSVASPIPIDDPNSLPLAPAVLIEDFSIQNAEEGKLPTQNSEESHSKKTDSCFNPFRPIHPRCNHISYGCLTMVFLVFVGMAVLLKTYLPDILPPSISTEPSITRYEEKKLLASDGSNYNFFGSSCSISNDLVVIGAFGVGNYEGAAYLFHLDGTEIMKLTPGDNSNYFGYSVSIDEKVVVGTYSGADYFRVFSRDGIYERTIRCGGCKRFGDDVATNGNLIVTNEEQNDTWKLIVFSTEGRLLNTLEQGSQIYDVAISEKYIVSTAWDGKTFIYSSTSPDFPKIAEINQGGREVAVAGDRIVIGNYDVNNNDGVAYMYKIDGTLVKTLDRQDASSGSFFGASVAIIDDKVIVGAAYDDDQGEWSGSVFIYSAITGEFLEKVLAPDGETDNRFGSSVCASGSYFMVGAMGVDSDTGAAYLF